MKAVEVRKMTEEEIKLELERLRRHLFDLKSQAVTEKLEDSSQLGKVRKDVARLMTEHTNRKNSKATKA